MRRFISVLIACLLCVSSPMHALASSGISDSYNILTLINFFTAGEYGKASGILEKMPNDGAESVEYIRLFLDGWSALNAGELSGAQVIFDEIDEKTYKMSAALVKHREQILLYIAGRMREADYSGDFGAYMKSADRYNGGIEKYRQLLGDLDADAHIPAYVEKAIPFENMSDIYADASRRIDNLRKMVFTEGVSAYNQCLFDTAAELFATIPDYPEVEKYQQYCSVGIGKYERALELFGTGDMQKAVDMMREVEGYKDSVSYIREWEDLLNPRVFADLKVVGTSPVSVSLNWTDSKGPDNYYVEYVPSGLPLSAGKKRTLDACAAYLDGLIPNTTYQVNVSVNDPKADPLSVTARTDPVTPYEQADIIASGVYSYRRKILDTLGMEVMLAAGKEMSIVENDLIPLPKTRMDIHDTGYLLAINYIEKNPDPNREVSLVFVLRVNGGEAYISDTRIVPMEDTSLMLVYSPLGSLLDQYYTAHSTWQSSQVSFEVYMDGLLFAEYDCVLNAQ